MSSMKFSISGWIDPAKFEPLLQYLPVLDLPLEMIGKMNQEFDWSIPREVSHPIVSQLRGFLNEVDRIYRQYTSVLDNAYVRLAEEDDVRIASLENIASALLGKPVRELTDHHLYITHRALLRDRVGFGIINFESRVARLFSIRSKKQLEMLTTVQRWIREFRAALPSDPATKSPHLPDIPGGRQPDGYQIINRFIQHSKPLILSSRQNRDMRAEGLGPDKTAAPVSQSVLNFPNDTGDEAFIEQRAKIIQFFEAWTVQRNFISDDIAFSTLPGLVLRETGLYPQDTLDWIAGLTFLQEIGVVSPHINLALFNVDLLLPLSQYSTRLQKLATVAESTAKQPSIVEQDQMKHLRHDWGSLPIYCVDGPNTKDRDDGVSIEPVAGEPGHFWLRIHIANPTAVLGPDSILSILAQHQSETLYCPEGAHPMLPDTIIQHCSVRNNSPLLTFSAKVNMDGEVLDYDVRSASSKNVLFLTYDEVNAVNHPSYQSPFTRRVIGGPLANASRPSSLTEDTKKDLRLLRDITEALFRKRLKVVGIVGDYHHQMEVNVYAGVDSTGRGLPMPFATRTRKAQLQVHGDPIIEWITQPFKLDLFIDGHNDGKIHTADSRLLIQEVMLLAGQVGAKWTGARNLPSIYRGRTTQHGQEQAVMDFKLKHGSKAPTLAHTDVERFVLSQTLTVASGTGILSTQPVHHFGLGIDAYSLVTSPLRRFSDMVTHWQIEAALRHEFETRTSLVGSTHEKPWLPFQLQDVKRIARRTRLREFLIRTAQRTSTEKWIAHYLFRAFYYNEAPLPATWRVMLLKGSTTNNLFYPTMAIELDNCFNVQFERSRRDHIITEERLFQKYDIWEVAIDKIVPAQKLIGVKPVRLVSRLREEYAQEIRVIQEEVQRFGGPLKWF
jgi:hypothetical protein